jgi:coenzyme Q-binding protein COQ10
VPRIDETRFLPFSAEQMFDLVADVARYAEFLPWVVATRVRSDNEVEMVADMLVGFAALKEKFTSRVHKQRPSNIRVEYLDGPLKRLENYWTFVAIDAHNCRIEFQVDFSFRNSLFERLAGQHLDRALRRMVSAFEARAAALYTQPSAIGHG